MEIPRAIIRTVLHVAADIGAQFIHPLSAAFITADQRIGRHDIVAIIVGQRFSLENLFPHIIAVNDVVRTDQTSQVEGLGGGVESAGDTFRQIRYGLGGNMFFAFANHEIRPDFI